MNRRRVWLSVVLVALAACSKSTTTSSSGGGGTSEPPTGSPPAETSPASTSPAPTSSSGGGIQYYDCSSLLSDQEVKQATGLSDAVLFSQEHGEAIKGQTYCQYFSKQGISIAVSVATGPAFDQAYKPLEAAAQGNVSEIPGLGDAAGWSAAGNTLGFRVGSTGVTIIFANIGASGSLDTSDPEGAAIAMGKLIVSRL